MEELNTTLGTINSMAEAKDKENARLRKEVEKLAVEVAEQEKELEALRNQVMSLKPSKMRRISFCRHRKISNC